MTRDRWTVTPQRAAQSTAGQHLVSRRRALTFTVLGGTALFFAGNRARAADGDFYAGDLVLGDESAPVAIIEYASMTCPHCANFHGTTFKEIKSRFVDTGKAKMIFREFPFDQVGLQAAMLVRCGGPDKAFALLDVLFSQQANWSRAPDYLDQLAKIAGLAGIGRAKFNACLQNQDLANHIIQSRKVAQDKYNVDSTPSFVIDEKKYSGALGIEDFEKILSPYM